MTFRHSLNLSFTIIIYYMSFLPLYLTFHLDSLHRHPNSLILHMFAFLPRFPVFPRWFPTPIFPSHSSHSLPYSPHFPHFVPQFPVLPFTDSLRIIYFRKIVASVQQRTLLGTKLLFTSFMTSSVLRQKLFTLKYLQYKIYYL